MNKPVAGVPLGGMPVEVFLRDYWQQQPCLVRQAFPDFAPALDENDIAGLACEELSEARLVTGNLANANWLVEHGPFEEQRLAGLPGQDWCLLVQDVEKHYPPLQALLAQFSFLPSWRLDDLMVSVSAPGGSVGPHVDQYDVFLLQASGQRRWQVASQYNPTCLAGCDLRVLKEFQPEQEWLLQPGDMLYLPPGIAHYGLALDLGMTWSVGLRAPSQADLFQAFGDWLAEKETEQQGDGRRYTDPNLEPSRLSGEISPSALNQLADLFAVTRPSSATQSRKDPDLEGFLGSFMSRYRLAHQPAAPEKSTDLDTLLQKAASGACLQRNPWTRLNWVAHGGRARLFASGDERLCSHELATNLCGTGISRLDLNELETDDQQCVLDLLNLGHLFLQYPDD
jgi:50S ribosomal protein L16 3-hydroxylase